MIMEKSMKNRFGGRVAIDSSTSTGEEDEASTSVFTKLGVLSLVFFLAFSVIKALVRVMNPLPDKKNTRNAS